MVLVFFPEKRRALHVPGLLSLVSVAAVPLGVGATGESGALRVAFMWFVILGLAVFTAAQYRLLCSEGGMLCVRTLLGRRALPLDRVALGITASRSHHGLPLYMVHAEAEGRRVTLSDTASRARAERHVQRLRESLLVGVDDDGRASGGRSGDAPPGESFRERPGSRPLGGGRTWMIACVLGFLLGVLFMVGRWLALV